MPKTQNPKPQPDKQVVAPVIEFRCRLTKAIIWKYITQDGKVIYSVTFGRNFNITGYGWQETSTFELCDLTDMEECSKEARNWLRNVARQGEKEAAI